MWWSALVSASESAPPPPQGAAETVLEPAAAVPPGPPEAGSQDARAGGSQACKRIDCLPPADCLRAGGSQDACKQPPSRRPCPSRRPTVTASRTGEPECGRVARGPGPMAGFRVRHKLRVAGVPHTGGAAAGPGEATLRLSQWCWPGRPRGCSTDAGKSVTVVAPAASANSKAARARAPAAAGSACFPANHF